MITPHESIGPIRLGADRSFIRATLKRVGLRLEAERGSSDYFCESTIQVEFGDDGRADFIGIGSAPPFPIIYRGIDVFDVSATELFDLIARHEGSREHLFDRYEYVFPDQIVTLWDADSQYDHRGNRERLIWGQVGLGSSRYLEATRRDPSEPSRTVESQRRFGLRR